MKLNKSWLDKTVQIVIEHLNKFGLCVIDDFLGHEKGEDILEEVQGLQQQDLLREGQTGGGGAGGESAMYRSDRIVWTDGIQPHSPHLQSLIRSVRPDITPVSPLSLSSNLDSVVVTANKLEHNGSLGQYHISGRTSAMVACYPGEGSHYVKHVDNPNGDGRCVTAIYYLNKNWRPEVSWSHDQFRIPCFTLQRDGGALKIYPSYMDGAVATVDPLLDRVIFFWSDRRNPHAVMPAFRERFAVTVWYLDHNQKNTSSQKKGNK